jgi:hypothetical protein
MNEERSITTGTASSLDVKVTIPGDVARTLPGAEALPEVDADFKRQLDEAAMKRTKEHRP